MSKKRKTTSVKIGTLFVVSVMALAGASAGYALWSENLYIEGTVTTGSFDVEWSVELCYDTEPANKDVSGVTAEIDGDTLIVTVYNAYPCIWYYVDFDIHCIGTVPAHFTDWVINRGTLPASAELTITPLNDGGTTQLHQGDYWYGTLGIHLNNPGTEQGATYTFSISTIAHQYNEYPPSENIPPIADANGPYSGCVDESIEFDGSGSHDLDGSIVSYEWDFGDPNDPTPGSGVNPTHTYTSDGTYTVTLTVTDDDGDTDSDSVTITVEEKVISPDFEIVAKGSHLDLNSYILYLYATVRNNGAPGRGKVWAQGSIYQCGWDVKKLQTPYLESGGSTELTFTLRECAPLPEWAVDHNVWIGTDTSNPNAPIDFEIVAKNQQFVGGDTFYYYVTVYNNGGAGYGKVWTFVKVEKPYTGYEEKLQTPYLESGESTELTFTFENLGLSGDWQVSYNAWIE